MRAEEVKRYFDSLGLGDRVRYFDESCATVELAAAAVGCEPARIAKTLSFYGERALLVVCAGDTKIDTAKFKAAFGMKARMLAYDDVEETTGHRVGGVCPFCVKEGVVVYADVSLKRFDIVYPSAGSPNSAVELTCEELYSAAKARGWVDVTKGS